MPGMPPMPMPGKGGMSPGSMPGKTGTAELPLPPMAFRALSVLRTSVARMRGEPSYRPPNNYFLKDSLYNGQSGGGPPAPGKQEYRASLASLMGNAKDRAPKAVTPMSSFDRNKLSALTDGEFPSVSQRFDNTAANSEARQRSDAPPRAEPTRPPVRSDPPVRSAPPVRAEQPRPPVRAEQPRPPVRSDPPMRAEPRAVPQPAAGVPAWFLGLTSIKLKKRNGDVAVIVPKTASAPRTAAAPDRSDGGGSSGGSALSDSPRAPVTSSPPSAPKWFTPPKARYNTVNIPPPPPGGPPPRMNNMM